jgi:site-specific DNA recombinase
MRHRASTGDFCGGKPPFGYMTQKGWYHSLLKTGKSKKDAETEASSLYPQAGLLYVNETEAPTLKLIFETYLSTRSIRKTALTLNVQGIKSRNHDLWSFSSIKHILKNPVYAGHIRYAKRTHDPVKQKQIYRDKAQWIHADGNHEPLITPDIFSQVQSLLSEKNHKPVRSGRVYLLSGILKCGLCASRMIGGVGQVIRGKQYVYYKCKGKIEYGNTFCPGVTWRAADLERYVIDEITKLSHDRIFLQDKALMLSLLKEQLQARDPDREREQIEARIQTTRRKIDRLLTAFEDELESESIVKSRFQALKAELEALEGERSRLNEERDQGRVRLDALTLSFEQISNFSHEWEYLDPEGKRSRLQAIVKEVRATREQVEIDLFVNYEVNSGSESHALVPTSADLYSILESAQAGLWQ